jgi:nitroimidazol reductase NimA-like FMN-containing flavoprotein (pyridoxamine 5'-phosphate oxidase superfamily)
VSANETTPLAQPRRRDRAVGDEGWIRDFLRRAAYGNLATVHGGQPFLNMNIFAYDEARHAIYLHTARTGRTRSNVEADGRVCFGVSTMGRLLPASTALEFSVEYAGVTVFGRASVVSDEAEARDALQQLLDKYAPHLRPGRDYRAIAPEEIARTAVYRIDIEEWGGKQKVAPADFPGAFTYGRPPASDAAGDPNS